MHFVSKMLVAAVAVGALSTSASAAVVLSDQVQGSSQFSSPAGQTVVATFNDAGGTPLPANWSISGDLFTGTSSTAAAPGSIALDNTQYAAAEPGTPFTINLTSSLTTASSLTGLSIFLGSVDSYNSLTFNGTNGFTQTFTGSSLGVNDNGSQSSPTTNLRDYFTFAAADGVNQLVFTTTSPAFEFDNIAIAGVPEPATWAMMILGFGFVGFMMRSNRQKTAVVSA